MEELHISDPPQCLRLTVLVFVLVRIEFVLFPTIHADFLFLFWIFREILFRQLLAILLL